MINKDAKQQAGRARRQRAERGAEVAETGRAAEAWRASRVAETLMRAAKSLRRRHDKLDFIKIA